jgi:hypothetical protein
MFTRRHAIGDNLYTEVLEGYRDLLTGKPKHRCVVRWKYGMTLEEAITDAEKHLSGWLWASKCWSPRYGRKPSLDYCRSVRAAERGQQRLDTLRRVKSILSSSADQPRSEGSERDTDTEEAQC